MILSINQLQDSRNRILSVKGKKITKRFALSAASIALLLFVFAGSCVKPPEPNPVQQVVEELQRGMQGEGKYKKIGSFFRKRSSAIEALKKESRPKITKVMQVLQKAEDEEVMKEAIKNWVQAIEPVVTASLETLKGLLDISEKPLQDFIKRLERNNELSRYTCGMFLFVNSYMTYIKDTGGEWGEKIVQTFELSISNEEREQLAQEFNLLMQPIQNEILFFLINLRNDLGKGVPFVFTKHLPNLYGMLQSILDMFKTQYFYFLEKELATIGKNKLLTLGKNKGLKELNSLIAKLTNDINTLPELDVQMRKHLSTLNEQLTFVKQLN